MKYAKILTCFILIFALLSGVFYSLLATRYSLIPSALAFESTSTSFEMHGSAIESISGSSSSPSFSQQSAGGQNSTGIISNVKQIFSGVLYWLFGWYVPRYDQIHFRWRNDDGSEVAATWAQTEDSAYAGLPRSTNKRLRFEISNEGWTRGTAPTFQLQYATTTTCASGSYTAVPTDTSLAWQIVDSTYLTDGVATTDFVGSLANENTAFVAGQVKDTGNTTGAITLNSDNFTEIEYSIQATTNAVAGQAYCFRVLDSNLTPTKMIYTRYPAAVVAGYAATGSVISSTYDTGLADGAAYNSLVWQGALNSGKVKFQLGTSNTDSGWTYYGPNCTTGTWYDASPNTSVEIGCPAIHNNKRYFRYQIQLCAASDCASSSANTPQVDDVSVNWSP